MSTTKQIIAQTETFDYQQATLAVQVINPPHRRYQSSGPKSCACTARLFSDMRRIGSLLAGIHR